ncbi:MAG: hypothetical protein AAF357_17985, partial [Verrucomicrobiota bacterium]
WGLEYHWMGNTIYFDRAPDSQRFEIEIDSLSLKDRIFCFQLREAQPSPPKVVEEKEKEDRYIEIRRVEIEKLRVKEKVIQDEISSKTLSKLLHQNRIDQIAKVQKEIRELELAIKTYNYRMKKEE